MDHITEQLGTGLTVTAISLVPVLWALEPTTRE
jgi:hypothetical protein